MTQELRQSMPPLAPLVPLDGKEADVPQPISAKSEVEASEIQSSALPPPLEAASGQPQEDRPKNLSLPELKPTSDPSTSTVPRASSDRIAVTLANEREKASEKSSIETDKQTTINSLALDTSQQVIAQPPPAISVAPSQPAPSCEDKRVFVKVQIEDDPDISDMRVPLDSTIETVKVQIEEASLSADY